MAANPSIQLGTDGNWAIKEDNLLAYKKDGTRFFNKEFDFTRNTTATFVDKDGLIKTVTSDIPRIDFTDDATGHLLLEPQSTNLAIFSEDFSGYAWLVFGSIQANSSVSPNGLATATKLTSTGTQYHLVRIGFSGLATTSVFVKNVDANNFYIRKSNDDYAYYNFNTKTVSDNSLKVEHFANDWVRLSLTTQATNYRQFGVGVNETDLSEVGNSVHIWGAQVEQQSFATSYIPTQGSTVTRNADVCNNSGSAQDFNSEEGVLYAEIAALANSGNKRRISLSDGTDLNGVILSLPIPDDVIKILIKSGGAIQANSTSTVVITATDFNKIAAKYKDNDFALWVDGTKVFTDSSGSVPIGLNELSFNFNGGENFYGKTKDLKVFKRAMSDSELYLLTVPQYQSYQEMATALNYTL